jgi:hypothetical protein
MSIFRFNKCFSMAILTFRFENNDLEFKYQFLDQISFLSLNKFFYNWNVNFQIQIIVFRIEMSIFGLN